MLAIAQKTIEWHDAKAAEAEPRAIVELAYLRFKRSNDIDFVTKHTPEWDEMCEATVSEYTVLARAQRATYNAKRRLETAVKAYKRIENGEATE
ncbi:hypothetical protein EKL30_16965 [Candidimonas sp. SYP-B2681]|uniref:hypothetical protein n=1 Tax=Candidimonas sp. SYP-B2681 TaxID=2497686 RepID=UPI000F87F5D1|nr:hypothetical protein [Candidimonas sp. SYP-B2681]RTZ39949.1 hypothetical protein EKL30_16965 [Candidimonas sp. SYP-B2681]